MLFIFIFCLLISNLAEIKIFDFFGLAQIGGGTIFFPLLYVLNDIITEVYGFASLASFCNNTHLGDLNGNFKGKFTRLAIQPSITYKTKYFEAAVSSRINHLHYYKIRGQYELYDELLENTPDNFFIEPAITLRMGLNKVKLQLQYQHSYWLNSHNHYENNNEVKYPFTKMNFTAGLKFDL